MSVPSDSIIFLQDLEADPAQLPHKFESSDAVALIAQDMILAILLTQERYAALLQAEKRLNTLTAAPDCVCEGHESAGENPLKIGAFVRSQMEKLFHEKRLSQSDVKNLCSLDYCRRVFRISFPVLVAVPSECQSNPQLLRSYCCDKKGRLRYYMQVYPLCGGGYILCNNWKEDPHRKTFTAWLRTI